MKHCKLFKCSNGGIDVILKVQTMTDNAIVRIPYQSYNGPHQPVYQHTVSPDLSSHHWYPLYS